MIESLTLRDGRAVLVRPIGPDDVGRLAAAFASLSPRSRFQRFLGHMGALSPETLRYFTHVDHRDHLAVVALDPSLPGTPLVGVARCIRLQEAPDAGDMAITVVDSHHGLGLGTLLLGALARWMVEQGAGIKFFRADVLSKNRPMIEILEQLGARVLETYEDTLTFEVPVPGDAEHLPDTPAGRAIRAAAREELVLRTR